MSEQTLEGIEWIVVRRADVEQLMRERDEALDFCRRVLRLVGSRSRALRRDEP